MASAAIPYKIALYWTNPEQQTSMALQSAGIVNGRRTSLRGADTDCFFYDEDCEAEISHWLEDGEFAFRLNAFRNFLGFEFSARSAAPGARDIFKAARELLEWDGEFGAAAWDAAANDYVDLGRDRDGAPLGLASR